MNHGDGVAPVALAADEPVAQAELHRLAAAAMLAKPFDDRVHRLGVLAALEASELAGLDQVALGDHGAVPVDGADAQLALVSELGVERVVLLADDGGDLQAVLLCEVEVTLVTAGDAHDRTGAVVHQDVVGDPDGDWAAVDGVDDVATGGHAVLLALGPLALDAGDLLGSRPELLEGHLALRARNQLRRKRGLRRQQHERDAKERVRTRGEDRHLTIRGRHAVLGGKGEVDLGTLGATDPVALLGLDVLRPAIEPVEVVQELLGVVGDAQVPLGELALLGYGTTAPAPAVHDLLVGKDRLAGGAPVDGGRGAVRQAPLPHLDEHPLAPPVVLGIAGVEHAVVVVAEAHTPHGLDRLGDVLVRPPGGLRVVLDGGVLRRKAEGVEAHGVQHVEAPHAGLAGHRVADGVVARVTHVQVARGIREHLEHIPLGLGGVLVGLVEALVLPDALPLGLDGLGIVGRVAAVVGLALAHGGSSSLHASHLVTA